MIARLLTAVLLVPLLAGVRPAPAQQTRISTTVFDEKTGETISGLTAANFAVTDGKTKLRVDNVEYKQSPLDILLLVDTSMLGDRVRSLAATMINGLGEGEQMALVVYHEGADLLQDFTSSKQALQSAFERVQYGNNPRGLDALFAAIDGGFEASSGRRVIILLTAGVEGFSKTAPAEVLAQARRRGVTIHTAFYESADAGLFRRLALNAGGAYFNVKKLKLRQDKMAALIYAAARGRYDLDLSGVYGLGDRLKVEIVGLPKSKRKIKASALAVE